jgi:hypothetical protein
MRLHKITANQAGALAASFGICTASKVASRPFDYWIQIIDVIG